ncbi:MAG: hypothetical protein WDO15_30695 [Bacteroidota bacterium]
MAAEHKAATAIATEAVTAPEKDLSALSADTTKSDLEKQLGADSAKTANVLDSLRSAGVSPLLSLSNPESPFLYNLRDTSTINSALKRRKR